ncbi:retrovirus-related pol polyprotein from transposon TNT 1-94 [Tanacetum coccineum]|uniref:Retrovirus-related pol polyprotein from transposon TNT 1-94 n=1 Tax=Tanacetum coccineum TaxID=301880 RepID=A0ABQ5H4Z1_9ASTR
MLEMKMGEPDYFGRAMVTENNMRNCGEDMDDVKIVEKILRTLRENFNFVVCSIEESKDIDKLTVDELQSSLLVHKQKVKQKGGDEQVLKIEYDSNFRRGRGRGKVTRGGSSYWGRGQEELLLMAYAEHEETKNKEAWFLDSGCSNHMTGNKDWFVQIDDSFKHTVKLGNNSRLAVTGKGNIRLEVQGITQTITNVYLVRELTANLLSIWQLQEKGVTFVINSSMCKIPPSGLIATTRITVNPMFKLLAVKTKLIKMDKAETEEHHSQDDPDSFEEAPKEEKWVEAMKSELRAMEKNKPWELVALPLRGAKKIGVKWVFKTKLSEDGKLNKYKARLVVKGL